MSNHDELIFGTDPNNPDSDGDGVSDGDEVNQGSDPNDASDGGLPPPPEEILEVRLTIGDHSGSHSERWAMTVGPISLRAPGHGQVVTRDFKYRRGRVYPVTIQHLGSIVSPPDYDYTARIVPLESAKALVLDPDAMLGVHNESYFNFAADKEAFLIIPRLDLALDINNDGVIDDQDEEDEENIPGRLIVVNGDDDNANNVPDYQDGSEVTGGLELATAYLEFLPADAPLSGNSTWTLTYGNKIRVYLDEAKNTLVETGAANPFPPPGSVYIESVSPSDAAGDQELVLSCWVEIDSASGGSSYSAEDRAVLTGVTLEVHDLRHWRPIFTSLTDGFWDAPTLRDNDFDRPGTNTLVDGAITDGASVCLLRIMPPDLDVDDAAFSINIKNSADSLAQSVEVLGHVQPVIFGADDQPVKEALPDVPLRIGEGGAIAQGSMNRRMAFYVPPASYVDPARSGGSPGLNSEEECRVQFEISWNGLPIGHHDFVLRRPPLVLMHGLNSGPDTWDTDEWNEDRFKTRIHKIDYSQTNRSGYDINWKKIPTAINDAISPYHQGQYNGRTYAASRVDFVGHSMGGVLGRLYISSLDDVDQEPRADGHRKIDIQRSHDNPFEHYHWSGNWGCGSFRRFVSIGAPFDGSGWADSANVALKTVQAAGQVRKSIRDSPSIRQRIRNLVEPPANQPGHLDFKDFIRYFDFPDAIIDLMPTSAIRSLVDQSEYPGGNKQISGLTDANVVNGDIIVHKDSQLNGHAPIVGTLFANTIHAIADRVNARLGTSFDDETSSPAIADEAATLLYGYDPSKWTGSIDQ